MGGLYDPASPVACGTGVGGTGVPPVWVEEDRPEAGPTYSTGQPLRGRVSGEGGLVVGALFLESVEWTGCAGGARMTMSAPCRESLDRPARCGTLDLVCPPDERTFDRKPSFPGAAD